MNKQLEFRGLSQKTMVKYLLSIAELTYDHIITNKDQSVVIKKPNWSVMVSEELTYNASAIISFPQLFLTFTGEEMVIDQVIERLRTKTLRLGG